MAIEQIRREYIAPDRIRNVLQGSDHGQRTRTVARGEPAQDEAVADAVLEGEGVLEDLADHIGAGVVRSCDRVHRHKQSVSKAPKD